MWKVSNITLSTFHILQKTKRMQLSFAFKEKPFYPLFQAKSRGFATAKLEDQDICSHITNKSAAYLPFGIQNFENLRRKGYLYVDKTNLVSQIALTSPRVFLSRPRRFGKSLVLSTLQAIFEGKKHLFKDDLFIKSTNYEFWKRFENKYNVIKLDFSEISESGSFEEFQKKFGGMLQRAVDTRSIELKRDFPSEMFESLIKRLNPSRPRESRIVLLIDEYDAPLNNARGEEHFKAIQRELRSFYSMVKALDEHFEFVFITGVAKYTQTSIFSGMNNLKDISYMPQYQALCGFTEKEVRTCFKSQISSLASEKGKKEEEIITEILNNFYGYRFVPTIESSQRVISPQIFYSYLEHGGGVGEASWFNTDSPSFLLQLLKSSNVNLLKSLVFEKAALSMGEVKNSIAPEDYIKHVPLLLFQAGYLTFAPTAEQEKSEYGLIFPNLDIKEPFSQLIAQALMPKVEQNEFSKIMLQLRDGDYKAYFDFIYLYFDDILSKLKKESKGDNEHVYHSCLSLINRVLINNTKGVIIDDRKLQATDKVDTFITLEDRIVFSFEVKVDRSSEVGERQIKENYFQSRKHSELESALVEKVERPSSLGPETIETKKIFYWNASPDLLLYKRKL